MKKILLFPLIFLALLSRAQTVCLSPMCNAQHSVVGDTATLGALFSSTNGVAYVTFTFVSGPNTPVISAVSNGWSTSLADTARIAVTGLAAGTYLFKVLGKDKDSIGVSGIDSLVVAAACPAAPAPPTITGVSLTLYGTVVPVTAGNGTKITYTYNGQTYTIVY